ncbi:uncharacterized protein BDR25DRAFT_396440 [Lindgomyces ingoldianus]|uniref:Uncharacterized protein n=1 Tax=Lindgomyces ingoldianus TaxID=673940 RepID=A0ACB6QFA5_9PLEO|nr:uncharacterized protein BDR25DRAFT_396440 [Lindgomyces ingoldianus]KAF2465042.1 hypothetical protein BDR25DRAFT_396440 [Lindgomyces ingoldianus]
MGSCDCLADNPKASLFSDDRFLSRAREHLGAHLININEYPDEKFSQRTSNAQPPYLVQLPAWAFNRLTATQLFVSHATNFNFYSEDSHITARMSKHRSMMRPIIIDATVLFHRIDRDEVEICFPEPLLMHTRAAPSGCALPIKNFPGVLFALLPFRSPRMVVRTTSTFPQGKLGLLKGHLGT